MSAVVLESLVSLEWVSTWSVCECSPSFPMEDRIFSLSSHGKALRVGMSSGNTARLRPRATAALRHTCLMRGPRTEASEESLSCPCVKKTRVSHPEQETQRHARTHKYTHKHTCTETLCTHPLYHTHASQSQQHVPMHSNMHTQTIILNVFKINP